MVEWNPFWTDMVKIENGGRYPLLLNRFHDHLEEYLIKSIVSTTDRLRYISYCCWAIGDIEHTMNCKVYYEFEEAFRRRESALAVGTYILQPKSSVGNYAIYGTEAMKNMVDSENKNYDCTFKVLPSQQLGAFGQYYKGTLQNWGLIYVDENGIIKLTEIGNELYKIMDMSLINSEYYKLYKGKKKVPGIVLKKWAICNEYDNITDLLHKKERDLYKNILFHLDQNDVTDYRRNSLIIYLEATMECNQKNICFDENVLRNILYYQKIIINNEIVEVKLSPFLGDTLFYWSMYEIHVYFRWWISEYFRFFLQKLSSSTDGLTLDEVFEDFNIEKFNIKILEIIGKELDYYTLTLNEMFELVSDINQSKQCFLEDKLSNVFLEDFSHVSAYLLMILSMLYDKYKIIKDDYRYVKVKMQLVDDYWYDELYRDFENVGEYNIAQFLKFLLNRYVINKHNNAMYAKNDLRRCWFTKSGDNYQHQADAKSIWRPAKHNIICHFIFDMKLAEYKKDCLVLTEEGKELYKLLKEKISNEQ